MVSYFPLISGIISAVFTILLGVQYTQRRKKHQLVWTISLAMFTLSFILAFLSETNGWSPLSYQVYYFIVSPMVALLGVGTLYLFQNKPWGKYFFAYTVVLSAVFFVLVFSASVITTTLTTFSPPSEIGGQAMPSSVRSLSPLFSVTGGLLLIVGALYSFWLNRSKRYTLLIALGGIIYVLSGFLERLGYSTYFNVFSLVGIILLFLGFLFSSEYIKKREEK